MPIYPVKQPRPWYHPHASTWVVIAVALAGTALWNVAGYYDDPEPYFGRDEAWTYGWPQTYLKREIVWYDSKGMVVNHPRFFGEGELHWQDSLTPWLWRRVREFRAAALLVDVTIAIAVVSVVGIIFESWRRRRHRIYQFHLLDLCLLLVLVSIALGWGRPALNSWRTTEAAAKDLEEKQRLIIGQAHGTPECIRVWLPGERWKPGDYVRTAQSTHGMWTREDVAAIAAHPRLEHLELINVGIPPEGWNELAKMRSLRTLRLANSAISPRPMVPGKAGYSALAGIPNLKRLVLETPDLCEDYVRDVAKIKSLEELVFWTSPDESCIDGSWMRHLAVLPKLRSLELTGGWLLDRRDDLSGLAELRTLRSLTINRGLLTPKDVDALCQLSDLEHLGLKGLCTWDIPNHEKLLASLPRLKSLTFEIGPTDDSLWRSLPELTRLEELDVGGYGDEDFRSVCRVRSLRRLRFDAEHLTNEGIRELIHLPRLFSLRLGSPLVDDQSINQFIALKHLGHIDLTDCPKITPAGIKRLADMRPDLYVDERRER